MGIKPFWNRKDWKTEIIHNSVKPLLINALSIISEALPEPTEENCERQNGKTLCRIRNEFFRRLQLSKTHTRVLRAILNFGIVMYEHDSPYRQMMDWCKEKLDKELWEPRPPHTPDIQMWLQDWQLEMEVLGNGQLCPCGGKIDKICKVNLYHWRGRCFQCGKDVLVVEDEKATI